MICLWNCGIRVIIIFNKLHETVTNKSEWTLNKQEEKSVDMPVLMHRLSVMNCKPHNRLKKRNLPMVTMILLLQIIVLLGSSS